MKRISLIIPVYNAAPYLPALIESLETQDWENLQLLFSDDGSTDGSGEILTAFASRDARVTVLFGENGGVSAARNRALALADGAYIGFADADDVLDPAYLRTLASALEETGCGMACCGFTRIYAAGGKEETLPFGTHENEQTDRDGMARLLLWPEYYTTVLWNKLFRRETLTGPDGQLLRFDERLHIAEDGEYLFRSHVESAVFFPKPLYRYFVRTSGAMYGAVTERKLSELSARRKIADIAASMSPDTADLARMKYQKGVRDLLFHATISGSGAMVQEFHGELDVYRRELFHSPALTGMDRFKYRIYRPIIEWNLRKIGAFLMQMFGGR